MELQHPIMSKLWDLGGRTKINKKERRRKSIVVLPEDIEEIIDKGSNMKDWVEKYPVELEDIDEGLPDPKGRPLSTEVYFDSAHAHDQVTQQ